MNKYIIKPKRGIGYETIHDELIKGIINGIEYVPVESVFKIELMTIECMVKNFHFPENFKESLLYNRISMTNSFLLKDISWYD